MNRKVKAAALTSILVLTPAAAVANSDSSIGIDVVSAQCDSFTFVPTFNADADATWSVEALYVDTENEDVYKRSNKSTGTVKFGDTVGPITIDPADQYLLWAYDIRTSVDGKGYVLYGELPLNCVGQTQQPEPEDNNSETPPTEPDNTGTPSEEDDNGTSEVPTNEESEIPGGDAGDGGTNEPTKVEESPAPVVIQPSFTG